MHINKAIQQYQYKKHVQMLTPWNRLSEVIRLRQYVVAHNQLTRISYCVYQNSIYVRFVVECVAQLDRALVRSPEVGSSNLPTFTILKCRLIKDSFIYYCKVFCLNAFFLFHRCTMLVNYWSVKIDSLFFLIEYIKYQNTLNAVSYI